MERSTGRDGMTDLIERIERAGEDEQRGLPKGVAVGRIEAWLRKRREDAMLKAYGGIQSCPWCKQCAQENNADWHFDAWPEDRMYDLLTCGVCGGTSLWIWGHGMHYQRPLDHPAIAAAALKAKDVG